MIQLYTAAENGCPSFRFLTGICQLLLLIRFGLCVWGCCELEGIEREVIVLCANVLSRYSLDEMERKWREKCGLAPPHYKPDALVHKRRSSAVLDYLYWELCV